jgi:hypothetical protein
MRHQVLRALVVAVGLLVVTSGASAQVVDLTGSFNGIQARQSATTSDCQSTTRRGHSPMPGTLRG